MDGPVPYLENNKKKFFLFYLKKIIFCENCNVLQIKTIVEFYFYKNNFMQNLNKF